VIITMMNMMMVVMVMMMIMVGGGGGDDNGDTITPRVPHYRHDVALQDDAEVQRVTGKYHPGWRVPEGHYAPLIK
jgi:hypothetical protein